MSEEKFPAAGSVHRKNPNRTFWCDGVARTVHGELPGSVRGGSEVDRSECKVFFLLVCCHLVSHTFGQRCCLSQETEDFTLV